MNEKLNIATGFGNIVLLDQQSVIGYITNERKVDDDLQ